MDEKTLQEAVNNISLIKGVIDQTSKSFAAFSKIFIYWGLLFILNSVFNSLVMANKEQSKNVMLRYPVLNYIIPVGVTAFLAFIIYRAVSRKMILVGLEKHLMKVWLLILAMNVIPPRIMIITAPPATDLANITVESNNFPVMLFSLSIALIVTSLFTGYKQLKYAGVIYIAMSVLLAYLNFTLFRDILIPFLQAILLPFTFLYTGFFLKSKQIGVN